MTEDIIEQDIEKRDEKAAAAAKKAAAKRAILAREYIAHLAGADATTKKRAGEVAEGLGLTLEQIEFDRLWLAKWFVAVEKLQKKSETTFARGVTVSKRKDLERRYKEQDRELRKERRKWKNHEVWPDELRNMREFQQARPDLFDGNVVVGGVPIPRPAGLEIPEYEAPNPPDSYIVADRLSQNQITEPFEWDGGPALIRFSGEFHGAIIAIQVKTRGEWRNLESRFIVRQPGVEYVDLDEGTPCRVSLANSSASKVVEPQLTGLAAYSEDELREMSDEEINSLVAEDPPEQPRIAPPISQTCVTVSIESLPKEFDDEEEFDEHESYLPGEQ